MIENVFAGALPSDSEDNLIKAAQAGNLKAFGILYERYKNPVHFFVVKSVSRREDAEDITQETFCRAWKALPRFRGEAKLLSWLYLIAANLCKDLARAEPRRPSPASEMGFDIEELADISGSSPSPESRSITKQEISWALEFLPVTHRILVILCDVQGFTCKEAAHIAGCSAVSARVRLCQARKKLRSLLAGALDEVI